jgi:hypothetical protein
MLLETSICTKLEDKKEMPNYGNPTYGEEIIYTTNKVFNKLSQIG